MLCYMHLTFLFVADFLELSRGDVCHNQHAIALLCGWHYLNLLLPPSQINYRFFVFVLQV
jgi:hypothetical protein